MIIVIYTMIIVNNDEFELEADEIIDFAETNPFGTY